MAQETAEQYVKDALSNISVRDAEAPLQTKEAQDGIRRMNDMMAAFTIEGINLGYTVITLPNELVTIPDSAKQGVKFNLSIVLSPEYGVEPTPNLVARAELSKDILTRISSPGPIIVAFPPTLPIGTGNECPGTSNRHFYGTPEDFVEGEDGGNIVVEGGTP